MIASETDAPATRALSVYNVLRMKSAQPFLTPAEALECLREFFDPDYREDWVSEGVNFLLERGLTVPVGDQFAAAQRGSDGKPKPLKRTRDLLDLEIA